ncbi:MAG: cytochrome c3 family protein [Bacteroidota bacterium]
MLNIKSFKTITTFLILCLFASIGFSQADSTAAASSGGGDVANGETLFKNNCASCHNPTEEASIGPGLKGIESRRDYAWIKPWVNNSAKVIESGDAYAVALYNQYNKAQMTSFPTYGDKEIKDILAYVASYQPPVAAVAAATPGSTTESSNGGMFQYLLIGILAIMVMVLLALLGMVNAIAKSNKGVTSEDDSSASFMESLMAQFKELSKSGAVKGGIITLAILLLGKATIDGLYGIGIHQGYAPTQPISFSHKLHAGDYKIDCNYCHTGVYKGKGANIPSANICMNCHNAIKQGSPEIQKIYRAIEKDEPIQWVRVHNLPDFAYFNHSQHTNVAGLDCANCHGEVAQMEVLQQRSSLTMGWCIDCHRKTDVNSEGNAYYDKLLEVHKKDHKEPLKVKDIGGLECSKCHY